MKWYGIGQNKTKSKSIQSIAGAVVGIQQHTSQCSLECRRLILAYRFQSSFNVLPTIRCTSRIRIKVCTEFSKSFFFFNLQCFERSIHALTFFQLMQTIRQNTSLLLHMELAFFTDCKFHSNLEKKVVPIMNSTSPFITLLLV